MKRLLLLLPLFLLAPAQAGNLGAADYVFHGVGKQQSEKISSFRVHISPVRWTKPHATASFADGRFTIKTDQKQIDKLVDRGFIPLGLDLDESGILPEQVISFHTSITNLGIIFKFQLLYRDSGGRIQLANWAILDVDRNTRERHSF